MIMKRAVRASLVAMALLMTGPAMAQAREARSSPGSAAVQPVVLLDLNTATLEELVALPGIGPARARAILDHRAKRGRFKSVAELRQIRGIGRKTLARLRPYLTVSPPPRR